MKIFQILSLWTGTKSLKPMSKYEFSVMHGRAKVNKNMSSALNLATKIDRSVNLDKVVFNAS